MAIKRVIIHLGMAKAGSSSIQDALFNNASILEKNGFRYLTEWGRNHFRIFHYLFSQSPTNPIGTGHLGRTPSLKRIQNRKSINSMMKVIDTTKCETLVLSGEYFHELYLDSTIKNMEAFINKYFTSNGIETSVIYIIRNPLSWMISFLQELFYKRGFLNKDGDFFDDIIRQYNGIINLKKRFPGSLIILKFEDICMDENSLVNCFLKSIGFPEQELGNINTRRKNESRCMEVMEFIYYVESIAPRYPYTNYRRRNPSRSRGDFSCILSIKGVKFDLPYQSKQELWARLQETVYLLKEYTGIDYTDYNVSPSPSQELYKNETIQGFAESFHKLNYTLQKHFLKFFEKKYMETAEEKFKQLHFKNSIPYRHYNSKNYIINYLATLIKNKIRNFNLFND